MAATRWVGLFLQVAVIFFSSTRSAAQYSINAFQYLRALLGLWTSPLLQLMADKGLHFALFFSLGMWVSCGLKAPWVRKLIWAVGICLLIGSASEILQIFTGRDPSLADVLLNAASGTLAAALAIRLGL